MALLNELQPWHWFVIGIVLLVLETFGAGGFLIGIAAAAILMAALTWWLVDISWQWQLILFAAGAVIFTFLYLRFFKAFNQQTDAPNLNNRTARLIGTRFQLAETVRGQGSVQLGDTRWKVTCEGAIEAGSQVQVTGSDGMTLMIAPA